MTNKVDRSVWDLLPNNNVSDLQTPINNYGLISLDYHDTKGSVIAIGEQPIKGLMNPEAMARLKALEMITNMIWVKINDIQILNVPNWMWSLNKYGRIIDL